MNKIFQFFSHTNMYFVLQGISSFIKKIKVEEAYSLQESIRVHD